MVATAASRRARRSVLYVPASNERALGKLAQLACDSVIFDLEDAVAPENKHAARETLRRFFDATPEGAETVIRINAQYGEWGADDLQLACALKPDAILLPKVDTPRDILDGCDYLNAHASGSIELWSMIETPNALLDLAAIAGLGRDPTAPLVCLVAGTNDLVKETGVAMTPDRRYLTPWLMQMVLAGRAGGLDVLDGVCNDFRNLDAFEKECAEAAAMGFDGKTLIHPAQIAPANTAFAPSRQALAEAQAIVDAFSAEENSGRSIVSLDGRMIERLHLAQAEKLLARAAVIRA